MPSTTSGNTKSAEQVPNESEIILPNGSPHCGLSTKTCPPVALSVQIAQMRDLIATHYIDIAIDNAQSQGLTQSCGEALPFQVFEFLIDSADYPHFTVDGAEHSIFVGQEIMIADKEERFLRVL